MFEMLLLALIKQVIGCTYVDGLAGLACAQAASKLGARVACLDFVKPTTHGTTWGLGGTCVNVGCIPKKLMHNAAIISEMAHDGADFGWNIPQVGHNWDTLVTRVQEHIQSLNFGYRVQLREASVTYMNKLAKFIDPHRIECTDKKGKTSVVTAARFVIAVGGRPTPLSCPGAELAITSDDLFSLKKSPGKTCVVGGGYVALECAGFLKSFGFDVTVSVRSILLRGFDRECADKIQDYMQGQVCDNAFDVQFQCLLSPWCLMRGACSSGHQLHDRNAANFDRTHVGRTLEGYLRERRG